MKEVHNESRPARKGKPWTDDEDLRLIDLFRQSKKLDEIVSLTERSPAGIYFRLKGKGLLPEDLTQDELPRFMDLRNRNNLGKRQHEENLRNRTVVLVWWQEANWELEPDQQGRFINHPTLAKIIELIPSDVKFAISELKLRKLDEIFGYAYGQYRLKVKENLLENQSFSNYLYLKSKAHNKVLEDLTVKYGKNSPKARLAKRIKSRHSHSATLKLGERGPKSLQRFGLVNPPPIKQEDLRHTSLYKCTICKKPVVGNSCACDGY